LGGIDHLSSHPRIVLRPFFPACKEYAASVKLEIEFEKFIFTDYLSLLLIDGKWLIAGKIYHFTPKK
jgi:hypothetical protein